MVREYTQSSSWYEGVYLDEKEPCPASRSFIFKNGSSRAVLCIHGFTGYPGELERPAVDLANEGFDVYVPRLPGHGTSGKDFNRSRAKDWLKAVDNVVKDLLSKYDEVSLVGHSMGTLISIIEASRHKEIKRLVLASPAFSPYLLDKKGLVVLLKIAHVFNAKFNIPWQSDPSFHLHYENAPECDEYLGSEYWSHLFTRQYNELYKLIKLATKELSNVEQEMLVLYGEKDEAVKDPSSFFEEKKAKIVKLENATHYIFYDRDRESEETAVSEVLKFLSSPETN